MVPLVQVKVGTDVFQFSPSELAAFPGSTLTSAYNFNSTHACYDFSYRPSTLFRVIEGVYRHGKLVVPENVKYQELKEELDFWGFELQLPVHQTLSAYVLDRQIVSAKGGTSVPCPWGMCVRNLGSSCWMPLVCFFWGSLIASPALIDAAALGYTEICLYIRHSVGDDKVGISLALSHRYFFERLAELSGCTLSFPEGVYGRSVLAEARVQDLFTNSHLTVKNWKYVHHQDLSVTCTRSRNDLHVTTTGSHRVQLVWRGFEVVLDIKKNGMFWDCSTNPVAEDPLCLSEVTGFMLRVSFVLDTTVFDGFTVPSTAARYHELKFNIYHSRLYDTNDPEWLRNLSSLTPTGGYALLSEAYLNTARSITLLVEEAEQGVIDLQRLNSNSALLQESYYERVNVAI